MLSPLPSSWSSLTWQQLRSCWDVKMRYGGNPDVARVAALLALYRLKVVRRPSSVSEETGESVYTLKGKDGQTWSITARELSYYARQSLPWFDYPYGDPGEKEEKDKDGKITKERREGVNGYVSPMRDAMILPQDTVSIPSGAFRKRRFSLPQVAMSNLTWQQYRSLQTIVPNLFSGGKDDALALENQAAFMANILVPRSFAILDTTGGSVRVRPHWEYRYNAEQAEALSKWFVRLLKKKRNLTSLFYVLFQVYQTAVAYYSVAYPLLFDGGKSDKMRDALQSEAGTINTIMKYAGYSEQQQVYDSNLPFVLDILNTMTKEAKEIEKMNAKIKKK